MDQNAVIVMRDWAGSQPVLAYLVVLTAEAAIYLLAPVLAAIYVWPGPGSGRRRRAVLASLVALGLAFLLLSSLHRVTYRPRPFVALPLQPLFPHVDDSSFPSGHTLIGMSLVEPFLFMLPRLGIWLFVFVLLIGLARVAAGVHYPSDILGAAVLAALPAATGVVLVRSALGSPL